MAIQLVLPLTNVNAPLATVITIDDADLDLVLSRRWMPPSPSFPHVYTFDSRNRTVYLSREIYKRNNRTDSVLKFVNGDRTDLRRENLDVYSNVDPLPIRYVTLTPDQLKLNDPYKSEIDKLRHY